MKSTKVFNWVVGIVAWLITTAMISWLFITVASSLTTFRIVIIIMASGLLSAGFLTIGISVACGLAYLVFNHVGKKTPKHA